MSLKPFDIHCHLYDRAFEHDRKSVIRQAQKVLAGIILAGEDPNSNRAILGLCKQWSGFLWPGLGLHPCYVHELTDEQIETELEFIAAQKPIALSEVGLDYFVLKRVLQSKLDLHKSRQIKVFEQLVALSKELDIPLIVHSRWAVKRVCEILERERPRAVLHGFTGSLKQAQDMLQIGCKISLSTALLYSRYQRAYAEKLPLEAFLLETDSPVMAPVKDERNVPANLILVVRELARIKGLPEERVIEETNKNISTYFNLHV